MYNGNYKLYSSSGSGVAVVKGHLGYILKGGHISLIDGLDVD